MENNIKKRNSIIEILRLCASLWVMYYHGMSLITRGSYFSNGRIAVDFFFILSGLFLYRSLDKIENKLSFKTYLKFIWNRFKPLAITFGICFIFSIADYIVFFDGFNEFIWGYLWYIPHLLICLSIYYWLFALIKNKQILFIVISIIASICYGLILSYVVDYGLFRGVAGIGMGIFVSLIPELKSSHKSLISLIITVGIFIGITLIAIFLPYREYEDPLCLLILFPAILYFAKQVNFSNNIVNKICSISVGLYCYQEIVSFFEDLGIIKTGWIMFIIVLFFAILDIVIKEIVKAIIKKKKPNIVA